MADQLLSQTDIDTLVSSLRRSEPAKPVNPAAPAPAKSTAASAGPKTTNIPMTRTQPAGVKQVQSGRQEHKSEVSVEMINTMNARIAYMTKQLVPMGVVLKRIELLEKKAAELENKIAKNREAPATTQRVQELSEAVKKISVNLKGTPGYGVKHSFNCEKCSDQGHVAVMYRCTKCGHERWYGWWPDKK